MSESLKQITVDILSSKDERMMSNLYKFFNKFKFEDESIDRELKTTNGIAISPAASAKCLIEYRRTAQFLRGIDKAIADLQTKFPDQKLNILYGGCGMWGTLLIPLMAVYKDKINVIFIDINQYSINCVKHITDRLGFNSCSFVCDDASNYTKPEEMDVHMMVVEAMDKAFIREPHFSIVKNLIPQIHDKGIMIPQIINVDLVFTDYNKEPKYHDGVMTTKITPSRSRTTNIMQVQKRFIYKNPDFNEMDASDVHKDACLLTSITIYDNIKLLSGESTITNPYGITSYWNLRKYKSIQLTYHADDNPHWEFKFKK